MSYTCQAKNLTPLEAQEFALHLINSNLQLETAELYFLENGANVEASDAEGRTALHSAAWQGHVKVVQLLIEHGALVDHTCNQGATALCIAAQEGHIDVVQVLLEHGADPNHADQFGRTAMRGKSENSNK
uniref:Uncharacterized protein n=1 Tax=Sus scrofa TaxID=9823 RepID=A0A4X1VH39_PIG